MQWLLEASWRQDLPYFPSIEHQSHRHGGRHGRHGRDGHHGRDDVGDDVRGELRELPNRSP